MIRLQTIFTLFPYTTLFRSELKAQKTEINATLTDIKQQLATIQSEIDQLTEQETNFESEKSAVQNTLHQFQVKLAEQDRKSTRLHSSHVAISYAVFCLKKTN